LPSYPFLSDEWIREARRIVEEYRDRAQEGTAPATIRMNQVITEVPFGDGTIEAHVDTTSGRMVPELGLMPDADVKVTLDYVTAREIFVEADMQVAMAAFMGGRIAIEGDMTMLLGALQQGSPYALAQEVHRRIREMTE
jgi:hypothetical protein